MVRWHAPCEGCLALVAFGPETATGQGCQGLDGALAGQDAANMARAETPERAVTTDANFRLAASKTACPRLRVRARSGTSVLR